MDSTEIKILRSCKEWTQDKLAQELGVRQPFITQLEKGGRPVPTAINDKLHAIRDEITDNMWTHHALRFLLQAVLDEPVGRLSGAVELADPEEVRRAAIEILGKLEGIEQK